jgi:hypothetical protein
VLFAEWPSSLSLGVPSKYIFLNHDKVPVQKVDAIFFYCFLLLEFTFFLTLSISPSHVTWSVRHKIQNVIISQKQQSLRKQRISVSTETLLLSRGIFHPSQVTTCSERACFFNPSAINMWIVRKSPHIYGEGAHPLK